ncbi:hypothetical protein [Bacteroides reticulotermitis]|uniref:DUF1566 domain-containing protein n=2 Tax=Bacteroides reticulotermitis TaxID=1133319 RepID=W4UQX8_9BACE|nr:hypothetical protein [Bacteroides reticulotermitis]MBB4043865.1 hypothetical protein [Bacteroides reticulotermitis]GAE83376.1 hypothetical protein JCM10512_1644 [Bacteroides reticulotermitis JCM 10512]
MRPIINIKNLNVYLNYPTGDKVSELLNAKASATTSTMSKDAKSYPNAYAPDGVYIATKEGNCWLPSHFKDSGETLRGVAVIGKGHRIVVAPNGSEKGIVLLDSNKTLPGDRYSDYTQGLKDNDGLSNTEKLLDLGSPAAKYCKELGEEWYLPTFAEMCLIHEYKKELDECLLLVGNSLYDGWHWTSTRYGDTSHFAFDWSNGCRCSGDQSGGDRVRPVSALSLTI